jgi:hypothetical protein
VTEGDGRVTEGDGRVTGVTARPRQEDSCRDRLDLLQVLPDL